MLDVVIRGGTIVDGTGEPGRPRRPRASQAGGSWRWAGSTSPPVGPSTPRGRWSRRASSISTRTTTPSCSGSRRSTPSPLHGVTTVVAGNCGLTLAPVAPGDEDFLTRLAGTGRVDPGRRAAGRPRVPLEDVSRVPRCRRARCPSASTSASWSATRPIRRAVMGAAASTDAASPEQLAAMRRCSRTRSPPAAWGSRRPTWPPRSTATDGRRRRTPRPAKRSSHWPPCAAAPGHVDRVHPRLVPAGFSDEDVELMADMSAAADRHLNWNTPLVNKQRRICTGGSCAASDVAAARGGRVVPMFMPQNGQTQQDFLRGLRVPRACPDGAGSSTSRAPSGAEALPEPEDRAAAGAAASPRPRPASRSWSATGASYFVNEVHDAPCASSKAAGSTTSRASAVSAPSTPWSTSPSPPGWTSVSSARSTPRTTNGLGRRRLRCSGIPASCSRLPTPAPTWT